MFEGSSLLFVSELKSANQPHGRNENSGGAWTWRNSPLMQNRNDCIFCRLLVLALRFLFIDVTLFVLVCCQVVPNLICPVMRQARVWSFFFCFFFVTFCSGTACSHSQRLLTHGGCKYFLKVAHFSESFQLFMKSGLLHLSVEVKSWAKASQYGRKVVSSDTFLLHRFQPCRPECELWSLPVTHVAGLLRFLKYIFLPFTSNEWCKSHATGDFLQLKHEMWLNFILDWNLYESCMGLLRGQFSAEFKIDRCPTHTVLLFFFDKIRIWV